MADSDQVLKSAGERVAWKCGICRRAVALIVLDAWDEHSADGDPYRQTVAKCESCLSPYVLLQDLEQVAALEYEWGVPTQMYPAMRFIDWSIPANVRNVLLEASENLNDRRWFSAGLGARRAVEMLCDERGARGRNLKTQLEWLRDNGQIDATTYEWSDAVRTVGNQAAHSADGLSEDDATDAVDFAVSLCDIIYVLPRRLRRHHSRRSR